MVNSVIHATLNPLLHGAARDMYVILIFVMILTSKTPIEPEHEMNFKPLRKKTGRQMIKFCCFETNKQVSFL